MDLAESESHTMAGLLGHNPQQAMERRPPIYNAEDYILGLKKFSKLTGLQLYLEQNSPLLETNDKVILHCFSKKMCQFGSDFMQPLRESRFSIDFR